MNRPRRNAQWALLSIDRQGFYGWSKRGKDELGVNELGEGCCLSTVVTNKKSIEKGKTQQALQLLMALQGRPVSHHLHLKGVNPHLPPLIEEPQEEEKIKKID